MSAVRAIPVILAAALALALTSCAPAPSTAGSASNANSDGASVAPSPTPTAVASVQPDPLIDLDCSDFAGVTSIGTIAGVPERDPGPVVAESLDVVPLADIVRNAGGIACEFSDGGLWRAPNGEGSQALNTAWRGAAIFVVPNVGSAADELIDDSACGDPIGSKFSVCEVSFAAGTSWVTVVSSTNDRGETYRAVRDATKAIVEQATVTAGPIVRPEGTFDPPRSCESLVPSAQVAGVLGGSNVTVERTIQLEVAAEATFVTEHTGCTWYRANGDSLASVLVYPGGGWAAERTLAKLDATPVALDGLRDGDMAMSHCIDVSAYDFWICTVEVVVDGTWVRGVGSAPDEATSTTIAVAVAEATLSHRG